MKVVFASGDKVSVMQVDGMSMTSQVESVFQLRSDKVVSMRLEQGGLQVSVYLVELADSGKSVLRQTLRRKLFGSSWILVN